MLVLQRRKQEWFVHSGPLGEAVNSRTRERAHLEIVFMALDEESLIVLKREPAPPFMKPRNF